ncbi:hypothetical protein K470DRAFT_111097 [Piedraia hortae CBS 480.64]|uniref:Uncharacterized protein n=1 Tax=Piedraia hortae CBS 480.64 TaxID=1314780 RepID=A0A6A7BUW6_9PEZI|nr:hypothetical protein K470DRAFT_111097 [Piedraia hortae CBS 480.64]
MCRPQESWPYARLLALLPLNNSTLLVVVLQHVCVFKQIKLCHIILAIGTTDCIGWTRDCKLVFCMGDARARIPDESR